MKQHKITIKLMTTRTLVPLACIDSVKRRNGNNRPIIESYISISSSEIDIDCDKHLTDCDLNDCDIKYIKYDIKYKIKLDVNGNEYIETCSNDFNIDSNKDELRRRRLIESLIIY